MTDLGKLLVEWVIIGAVVWSRGLRVLAWYHERRAQRKAERDAWLRLRDEEADARRRYRRLAREVLGVRRSRIAIRLDMWNLAANDLLAADLLIERIKETRNV